MNPKIETLLRDLHRRERALEGQLQRVSQRHPGHQEAYHVAQDIARWSRQHMERIVALGQGRGLDLASGEGSGDDRDLGEVGSDGGSAEDGLQLLTDMRTVYLHAADLSLHWVMLGQGAQAVKDAELLELSAQCHPGTLRQMRWANQMIKTSAPQVLAT